MNESVYKDQVLVVEPTGIEPVLAEQRHGSARDLFGVWFSANAEIATWMVGLLIVALYGTDLKSAIAGIVVGNVLGFALLGVLARFGPRYGTPQMVASRLAFGRYGNVAPATLSFFAGFGWFAIDSIFGAYALQSIAGLPYFVALAIVLVLQIVLAVYGYNLITRFEKYSAIALAAGFVLLGIATLEHAHWNAPFNPHAPLAGGGALAGFIYATVLSFSYATGWVPAASDYSRYLPKATDPKAIFKFAFAGCALPCIVLETIAAAAVTATTNISTSVPTDAIGALLGNGVIAKLVLLAIVLGTLTANVMNLYSGSLAALVAFSVKWPRWTVALVVGVLGALIALTGRDPQATANGYTNFLLLLSYWAAPWAAVVLVDLLKRGDAHADPTRAPKWRPGLIAWIIGLLVSLPFWNQMLYVGPFAKAFPQFADLSYYVGFVVAFAAMWVLDRETSSSVKGSAR